MGKYLVLSSLLVIISMIGLFVTRKHLITMLMALELLLLASNINFVMFSIFLDDILGQIYCFLLFTVGAAESAIGLALVIVFYRVRGSISSELIKHLKG